MSVLPTNIYIHASLGYIYTWCIGNAMASVLTIYF